MGQGQRDIGNGLFLLRRMVRCVRQALGWLETQQATLNQRRLQRRRQAHLQHSAGRLRFEVLEPRVLLSADISGGALPEPAAALSNIPSTVLIVDNAGDPPATEPVIVWSDYLSASAQSSAALGLNAALVNDSGISNSDGLTNDASVSGAVTGGGIITALRARFDAAPAYTDITAWLLESNTFILDPATLNTIAGGKLSDGAHVLQLQATDNGGNTANVDLALTLDTRGPVAPAMTLNVASDSGRSSGDAVTNDNTLTLTVASQAGSRVALFRNGIATGDALVGSGEIALGVLSDGTYQFTTTATDAAGNITSTPGALSITIDTAAPAAPSFDLALVSDTGTPGDRQTTAATVTLTGTAEPDALVRLLETGAETVANGSGAFQFDGVALTLGANAFTARATDRAGNTSTNFARTITRTAVDNDGPAITAALVNDTGSSNTDRITSGAAVSGSITDVNTIAAFSAGLDGTPVNSYTNLLARLVNGQYTLSAADLNALAGGSLADGAHTLHLRATDSLGNTGTQDLNFTLDTTAPGALAFGLSAASDTGTQGDGITSAQRVVLSGTTEIGAQVNIGGITALAGAGGLFQLTDVALADGANPLTLTATDLAGNTRQANSIITRSGTLSTDAVLSWNDIALRAVQLDVTDPPIATRNLALISLAQYDALAAIEGTPAFLVQRSVTGPVSAEAAATVAAHRMLTLMYPAQKAVFDAALNSSLAAIADGTAKDTGIALGLSIADAIWAVRQNDGSDAFIDYPGSTTVGQWRPTGPMFDVADEPQWKNVQPFVLTSPGEFRPPAPPALDAAAYATAVEEVKLLGSATSATRTADQTQMALFWADGKGSYTPPGHWNQIAAQVAQSKGNSLAANARLFAQLNVALADAAIAAWDAKYTFGLWRPENAIQDADLDNNAGTAVDETWRPLLLTPPHPEYVSGHSTFSAAAADVLIAVFGDNTAFSTTSSTLPGVTRSFTSFTQAMEEAGRSRIYGGIHFEFTNQAGQVLGKQVADAVMARFALTQDNQAPSVIMGATPTATNTNITLTGQVLDNLSGVAQAQYRIDGGVLQTLTLAANGGFSITTAFATNGSADGAHTITVQAMDAAGNAGANVIRAFTLDTVAPVLTITSLAEGDTLTASIRLTGTANPTGAALTSLRYQFDGGVARSILFDATTGAFDEPLVLGDLALGSHTLTLSAGDAAGNQSTLVRTVTLAQLPPLTIKAISPGNGASDVGVTFRPQVTFSRAVDVATLTANSLYATRPDGQKLAATIVPALDGSFAWLFFASPLPGASMVTLHVNGDLIQAAAGGALLDANGDGTPGGVLTQSFTTVSRTGIPGTMLTGKVVDPGADLEPMTFDDIRRGPDGIIHTPDDVFLNPIAHAKVYILGQEDRFVFTDADGNFTLPDVPVGNVKVAIDGRTATNAPSGIFFPEMVMDVTVRAGVTNTVMDSMGSTEEQLANQGRPEVYLPRVPTSILQNISNTETTIVGVDAIAAPNLSDEQRANLRLVVAPGSAIGENGEVLASAQIGISTVPSELVRDMLPPGVLQHTFDITIQAPGVAAFTQPVQITFPNVFNAQPGSKLNIVSFDHTTGRLVIDGTATVSTDGHSVTSDEGTGIRAPGWHGLAATGAVGAFIVAITDIADDPCVNFALGATGILVAGLTLGATALGATAALPALAAAGAAIFAAETVAAGLSLGKALALGQPGTDFAKLAAEDFTEGIGDMFVEGADVNQRIALVSHGAEGSAQVFFARELRSVGAVFQGANAFLKGLGWANVIGNGLKCYLDESSQASASRSAAEASASIITPHLQAVQNYFADFKYVLQPVEEAINLIFGDGVRRLLPANDSGYVLRRTNQGINVFTVDGQPYIDAGTGQQLVLQLTNLVDRTLQDDNSKIAQIQSLMNLAQVRMDGGDGARMTLSESGAIMFQELIEARDNELSKEPTIPAGSNIFVLIKSLSTGAVIYQGQQSSKVPMEVFLPSSAAISVEMFDAQTNSYGMEVFVTPASGQPFSGNYFSTNGSSVILVPDITEDSDFDGLSDLAENVVGTEVGVRDTDRDGVSDLAEILAGTSPSSNRVVSTGIQSTVLLQGQSKALNSNQSTSTRGLVVAVATGTYGVGFVDMAQLDRPVLLSEVDLPGDSLDIAFDGFLDVAAVASGGGGLNIVTLAGSVRNIAIKASVVEIVDGIVYVNNVGELRSYDLLSGERLQTLSLSDSAIVSIAREGSMLYTVDATRILRAIDFSSGQMVARGSLLLPNTPAKLFVGGGVAYIGAGNGNTAGFMTASVVNPDSLQLLSGVENNGIAGTAVASTGSGIGVAVGSSNFVFGNFRALDVIDLSNPSNTAGFLTRINLPEVPFDVTIAGGLAYVADGLGGLQVVNYRVFDNRGVAPTVSASSNLIDLDPIKPGMQVLEGSRVAMQSNVVDDVQVRNVELLVGGQVVRNDLSFPFDLGAALPTIAANGGTNVTLQVRATDTGGNVGLSAPIDIELVPDTFGPSLLSNSVTEGAIFGTGFRAVVLSFSEAIDPLALNATAIQILDGNGLAVNPQNVQFRLNGKTIQATFAPLAVGAYTLRVDAAQIKDHAGNALGAAVNATHFNIQQFTNEWINTAGGDWNDPANWSTGSVPTATDDVFIGLPEDITVTISSGAIRVASLVFRENFTVSGGSLELIGDARIDGRLTLSGGTLTGLGTLTITGTGSQWTGGTMTGGGTTRIAAGADLTVGGTQIKRLANRTITNEGTLIEGQTGGAFVDLDGAAVLNNAGLFDVQGDESWQNVFSPGGTLTINNTGTLRKSAGAGDFQFLSTALNNTGTVEVQAGRLGFGGNGGVSKGMFTTVAGTALVFLNGTQTWQNGAQATGNGAIELGLVGVQVGTLAVEGAAQVTRLDITAGVLSGLGTLTITGTGSQWTGGAMTGGGTTRIAAGADLTIGGTQDNKSLGNRTITNEGTLIDSQGGGRFVDLDGIAVLNNVGLCDIRGDESWQNVFTPTGSLD